MENKKERELEKKQGSISLDFSNNTKKGLKDILKTNISKYVNSESYFQDILEKNEFEELKTLVEDSEGRISWMKLLEKGVVRIENRRVEGIYWKRDLTLVGTELKSLGKLKKVGGNLNCEFIKVLENLGELEEVGGSLYLSESSIKTLGKLQKVGGNLFCMGLETLKDLGDLEEIGGYCFLNGTIVKTLGKLKKVGGHLDCKGVETLEDLGDLKEVGGSLFVEGTFVKLQMGLIEKINNQKIIITLPFFGGNIKGIEELLKQKEIPGFLSVIDLPLDIQIRTANMVVNGDLKLKGIIQFGGNIKGIEKLLDQSMIEGKFYLESAPFITQMEVLYRIIVEKVKIENLNEGEEFIDKFEFQDGITEEFNKFYKEGSLNYKVFQERYGEDIRQLEDKEQRKYAEIVLRREYKNSEEQIKKEGNKIREENEGKELTEEKQAELRAEVNGLVEKLKKEKEKIEGFGIYLDNL